RPGFAIATSNQFTPTDPRDGVAHLVNAAVLIRLLVFDVDCGYQIIGYAALGVQCADRACPDNDTCDHNGRVFQHETFSLLCVREHRGGRASTGSPSKTFPLRDDGHAWHETLL